METLSIKKYNEQQTQKWKADQDKALKEGRHISMLPQLAFYIFQKSYGYVAFAANVAVWGKTKKAAIEYYNQNYS